MQSYHAYQKARKRFWDNLALSRRSLKRFSKHYHHLVARKFKQVVLPGSRLVELGCGDGSLLASLEPSFGLGIDFSAGMLAIARQRHSHLHFSLADVHELPIEGKFDYVILSDLVNDVWDVQRVLQQALRLCHPGTRILLNFYSRLWQLPLNVGQQLSRGAADLEQNWLTVEDLENLMTLVGMEKVQHDQAILLPIFIPVLSGFANRFLAHIWPFSLFTLTNFITARNIQVWAPVSVSVVIPARNEAGNIAEIFRRVPAMGMKTELIFVEGHSGDDTYAQIESQLSSSPHPAKLLKQTGIGKADAVWQGFAAAQGEVLMILDADLSVPPEDLSRFYETLISGKAEFVNGVRLVYPMERGAMRSLNIVGNKFFSAAFSWLLGQTIKDTLCGTKVLWRADYERIRKHWSHLGETDPFGDFDLLFGASQLGLKIRDLPIRYRDRTYGETNIDRWRHGWLLLRMVFEAARWIKFS